MLPQSWCLTVCPKQMCLVIVDVAETGEGVLAKILTRLRSIGQKFQVPEICPATLSLISSTPKSIMNAPCFKGKL